MYIVIHTFFEKYFHLVSKEMFYIFLEENTQLCMRKFNKEYIRYTCDNLDKELTMYFMP